MKNNIICTLSNVNPTRDGIKSPNIGSVPDVLPEREKNVKGVSVNYAYDPSKKWFVLRVTYNRIIQASKLLQEYHIEFYFPQHYVQEFIHGKKKVVLKPFLPNLIFVYSTNECIHSFIRDNAGCTFINFYYDHFKKEGNRNPPLVVGYQEMMSFIRITSVDNKHIHIVNPKQCHYKSGDLVRIVEGDFKGVIGRVARVAGQQRVAVELDGLCTIVTAYIPSAFLESVKIEV